MPKILGVIPARFGSSRFPGKPLTNIEGLSMIRRVYLQCMKSQWLDEVIVATDDTRIYQEIKSNSGKVMMTSPTHENGTERIAEVALKQKNSDFIINIQGDEPCIHPKQIDGLIRFMLDNRNYTIGTQSFLSIEAEEWESEHNVKVVFDKNGNALDFFRLSNNKPNDFRKRNHQIGLHIGLYAFQRKTLLEIVELPQTENEMSLHLEQLRWMDHGFDIGVVPTDYRSPNVDIPEDLEKVIEFLKENPNE